MGSLRVFSAIGLLVVSNVFMTFAWYFHLRQRAWGLVMAIALSWVMAFPEYCLQVPANRGAGCTAPAAPRAAGSRRRPRAHRGPGSCRC